MGDLSVDQHLAEGGEQARAIAWFRKFQVDDVEIKSICDRWINIALVENIEIFTSAIEYQGLDPNKLLGTYLERLGTYAKASSLTMEDVFMDFTVKALILFLTRGSRIYLTEAEAGGKPKKSLKWQERTMKAAGRDAEAKALGHFINIATAMKIKASGAGAQDLTTITWSRIPLIFPRLAYETAKARDMKPNHRVPQALPPFGWVPGFASLIPKAIFAEIKVRSIMVLNAASFSVLIKKADVTGADLLGYLKNANESDYIDDAYRTKFFAEEGLVFGEYGATMVMTKAAKDIVNGASAYLK